MDPLCNAARTGAVIWIKGREGEGERETERAKDLAVINAHRNQAETAGIAQHKANNFASFAPIEPSGSGRCEYVAVRCSVVVRIGACALGRTQKYV